MSVIKDKKIGHKNVQGTTHRFHWYMVMAVVVVGVLGIAIKGVIMFIQISNDDFIAVDNDKGVVIFDTEKLKASIEKLDANDERHANILVAPPTVTDPS